MARSFLRRLFSKRRRYPIKRDAAGRSARRRCFDLFDEGKRPSESAPIVGISLKTSCRYFHDWKRLPRRLEERYEVLKSLMEHSPGFSESMLKNIVDILGISLEDVKERLEEPYGLKRLLMRRWPEQAGNSDDPPAPTDKYKQWNRLKAAILLIYIHEKRGVPKERIMEELEKLDREYYRPKPKKEEARNEP
jgi:hypothetical protein